MRRFALVLLSAVMIALLFIGCAGQQGYKKTENSGDRADEYPYLVKTESAAWYLAKADIELLGEDVFYEGLYAMLDDAEADMRDAREALKGFIPDEIPPVDILTDFCGKDSMAETGNAYYNGRENCIDPYKLYLGLGALASNGGLVGQRYYAVMNETVVRTEEMDADLQPGKLSLPEASGMIAYLVETCGRDTVFANWNVDPNAMETVFGKTFPELYREWAEWNAEKCGEMGIALR